MSHIEDINSIIPACLETDMDTRRAGIQRFLEAYSDVLGWDLAEHLRAGDKEIRARAMEALASAAPASLPVLTSLIEDEDWVVRYRAAEALGLAGDVRAVAALRAHLTDTKDHVRYMSVKSLGLLNAGVAAEEIAERLTCDENPYVRRMAVRTLAGMQPAEFADLFRRIREGEVDASVIAALDEALAAVKEHA
jgi:HEAT repeat protein